MSETRSLKIKGEHIELYQALKFEGIASSGGEAKFFISEGLVQVDGETETRKRKKVSPGSTILYQNISLKIESEA